MTNIVNTTRFDIHGQVIHAGAPHQPQQSFSVTHVSRAYAVAEGPHTWLSVPGTISKPGGGGISVEVTGSENGVPGRRRLPLTPEARRYLRESEQAGTRVLPADRTPIEVHINVHTGAAVLAFGPTSLLLNPNGHATSLVTFVKSHLPQTQSVLNALNTPPPNRPKAVVTAAATANGVGALPMEVLNVVAEHATPQSQRALNLTNRQMHFATQSHMYESEEFIFAGTRRVTDHQGNPITSGDGTQMRAYATVLGENGEPLVDDNGNQVQESHLAKQKYADFFVVPLDERDVIDDPNEPQLHNARGNIVLQFPRLPLRDLEGNFVRVMPTLNAHYYDTALNMIATQMTSRLQQTAALLAVTDSFRANPVAEYQPILTQAPNGTVTATFPPNLALALTSNHEIIRDWALERIVDHIRITGGAANETALIRQLLTLNGYQPAWQGRGLRSPIFGACHRAMFLSPHPHIRITASTLTREIRSMHGLVGQVNNLNNLQANRPASFRTGTVNGQPVVVVPAAYDSWLTPRSLDDQRRNLEELADAMRAAQPGARTAIARGFARFLVKNLADQPRERVEQLLYSDSVLLYHFNYFSKERAVFIHELRQAGRNGSIPADIVAEVAARMRIAHRNDQAQTNYAAALNNSVFAGEEFATFASSRRIDLIDLSTGAGVQANQQQALQQQALNDYSVDLANRNIANRAPFLNDAQQFLNWAQTVDPTTYPQ